MSGDEIFYRQPGESWYEGIPVGNGRLGGMVEGGVNCDHMYLNEETLWAGRPGEHERDNPCPSVQKARQLLFAGKTKEAEQVIVNEILPEDPWFGSYQVLGELTVRSLYPMEYQNYDRRLGASSCHQCFCLYGALCGTGRLLAYGRRMAGAALL